LFLEAKCRDFSHILRGLDEPFSRIHRIAHQHIEGAIRFRRIVHRDQKQGRLSGFIVVSHNWLRIHFTEAFISWMPILSRHPSLLIAYLFFIAVS